MSCESFRLPGLTSSEGSLNAGAPLGRGHPLLLGVGVSYQRRISTSFPGWRIPATSGLVRCLVTHGMAC